MADETVDLSGLTQTFEAFTPALIKALTSRVQDFANSLRTHAVTSYMNGGHPLHQRSGNLISALNVAPVTVTDTEVSTSVGDNIAYAIVHEQGGTFQIPAHIRRMSPRMASALGYKVPKGFNIESEVRAYSATYPQRAFLAPSIDDKRDDFTAEMEAAVADAAKEATNGAA